MFKLSCPATLFKKHLYLLANVRDRTEIVLFLANCFFFAFSWKSPTAMQIVITIWIFRDSKKRLTKRCSISPALTIQSLFERNAWITNVWFAFECKLDGKKIRFFSSANPWLFSLPPHFPFEPRLVLNEDFSAYLYSRRFIYSIWCRLIVIGGNKNLFFFRFRFTFICVSCFD